MKLQRNQKGFTLVEIMIVVAIIGLLAAIAIPNFTTARNTARVNACINNLRMIDASKEQAALANNIASGGTVTTAQAGAYLKGGWAGTTCPVTGTNAYTIGAVDTDPTCGNTGSSGHSGATL